ncbi:hypothetical protein HDG35_006924 [Paraburkholderia sp. JPY681]|nr:hypothetical protein [Paraburkholderia atlantica]
MPASGHSDESPQCDTFEFHRDHNFGRAFSALLGLRFADADTTRWEWISVMIRKLKSIYEMAEAKRKKVEKRKAALDKPPVRDIDVNAHLRTTPRGRKVMVKKHSRSR